MLSMSKETVALLALGSSKSITAVPSNVSKLPRTFVTIACRAVKPSRVWVGSKA